MKARIKWVENALFLGESGSGHSLVMDGAPEADGRNLGIRPMEAMLIGLGGCTAFDVVSILRRGRHRITDCVVEVAADRATSDPKVFTRIRLDYTVTGIGLEDKHVRRAIELSTEKYCSATAMLSTTATIGHGYSIVNLEDA